jgi:hypothetical protein
MGPLYRRLAPSPLNVPIVNVKAGNHSSKGGPAIKPTGPRTTGTGLWERNTQRNRALHCTVTTTTICEIEERNAVDTDDRSGKAPCAYPREERDQ